MEAHAEEASKAVILADKKLKHALNRTEPDYAGFEPLLEKLRVRCGNLTLAYLHLEISTRETEGRLWDAHVQVKGKLALWLKTFRDGNGKQKHVERRKAEKLFLDFIRASQRFYRAYIGRLPANFSRIPNVRDIAQKLNQEGLTAQEPQPATDQQKRALQESCKQCLIRLGDLARWKEAEVALKEKNWGPAKGYYNLALTLDPSEGACYNQHAAIAVVVEDHFGAIYYAYRAATVGKPHPLASKNLGREFTRILALPTDETYGLMENSGEDLVETLTKRFLTFHACCYAHPYDFVSFQQKAADILGMIALCFQESRHGLFDRFLERACLINIAAEFMAKKGIAEKPDPARPLTDKSAVENERCCQSFFLLQRFNLLTFQCLLKVLARELGEPAPEGSNVADLSRLSPVVRRVLPHLRQYSSWFSSNMQDLVETRYKSSRKVLEQVSKTYVQTLNLLRANIDVFAASPIQHLLDEDEKTLSFTPFTPKVYEWRYMSSSTKSVKPVRVDHGNGKDLAEELAETHLRATDLVVDALRLITNKDQLGLTVIPLSLDNGQFIEREIPEVELPKPPPSPPKQAWRRTHQSAASTDAPGSPGRPPSRHAPSQVLSEAEVRVGSPKRNKKHSARKSQNLEPTPPASRVSEQITPGTLISSDMVTGTPAAPPTAPVTAMDLVRQMQQSSMGSSAVPRSPDSGQRFAQPGLPSVYKTPFAPTASEQVQLSPRLDTAPKRSPSFAVPDLSSSAVFAEQLAQQQRDIQLRSSPQAVYQPTPHWTFGQTPTGMNSFLRTFEKHDRTPSPFTTPPFQVNGRAGPSRSPAETSPFGVIGQARPITQDTPPNGQG